MTNCILHNNGTYTREEFSSNDSWDAIRYQYLMRHLYPETDWILTNGVGNLSDCGIPINSSVLNTLTSLIGQEIRLTFNFAQKDCPEYREYVTEAERIDNLKKVKEAVSAHTDSLDDLIDDPEFLALCETAGIYYVDKHTLRNIDSTIESVTKCLDNSPCSASSNSGLTFYISNLNNAIHFLIMYAFYKTLIRIPYDDSAADDLPTIEAVSLSGCQTTLFDDLLHYIYDNAFDKVIADGNGEFYIAMHKTKSKYKMNPGRIPSPKKIKDKYTKFIIGIGGIGNPLYVSLSRMGFKNAYTTKSIECTLNLYRREEFMQARVHGTDLHEIGNDYLHSSTAYFSDILHFAIAFPYLISIIIGRLQQEERDLIIGYDTVLYSKAHGELVPSHIKTEYVKSDRLNQIWYQLIHKSYAYRF